jgi:hypothetical protein
MIYSRKCCLFVFQSSSNFLFCTFIDSLCLYPELLPRTSFSYITAQACNLTIVKFLLTVVQVQIRCYDEAKFTVTVTNEVENPEAIWLLDSYFNV